MDHSQLSILLSVCGGLFSVGFLVLALADRRQAQIEARLQQFPESPLRSAASLRPSAEPIPSGRRSADGQRDHQQDQPTTMPARETVPSAVSALSIGKLAGMIGPVLAAMLLAHWGYCDRKVALLTGSVVGLTYVALPAAWVRHKVTVRTTELRHALPDFLDLMIVCLEGGLSMQGALVRVAEEIRIAHPRLGNELQVVQRDVELGATIDVAFRNFANRSNLDEVRTLSSFIREAQRFGSQLGDALRSHAELLRYQREQTAEEYAQKASLKMLFPTLLLILPAVFVVLVGPAAIKIQEAFSK